MSAIDKIRVGGNDYAINYKALENKPVQSEPRQIRVPIWDIENMGATTVANLLINHDLFAVIDGVVDYGTSDRVETDTRWVPYESEPFGVIFGKNMYIAIECDQETGEYVAGVGEDDFYDDDGSETYYYAMNGDKVQALDAKYLPKHLRFGPSRNNPTKFKWYKGVSPIGQKTLEEQADDEYINDAERLHMALLESISYDKNMSAIVSINNVEYVCDFSGQGDGHTDTGTFIKADLQIRSTGEPICTIEQHTDAEDGTSTVVCILHSPYYDKAAEQVVTIDLCEESVVKIDPKYIPELLVYKGNSTNAYSITDALNLICSAANINMSFEKVEETPDVPF